MTFDTFSDQPGRRAASILELDLDGCQNSYGLAPCTATLALTNLSPRSEEMENNNPNGVTVVNNGSLGNDGTMTADKLEEIAVTGVHQISQSFAVVSGVTYTESFYVRKQERTQVAVLFSNATAFPSNPTIFVDLDSLTIISVSGSPDSFGIEPANNGLFRVWITATAVGTVTATIPRIRLVKGGLQSYLGTLTEGLDMWGVQFRQGTKPGKYQVTTAVAVDGMGVVDDLCFNTFGTCQDTPNYLKEVRTLRFVDRAVAPVGLIDAFPAIERVQYGATKIVPGGGFSVRGQVTVTLQDFSHNDGGVDDYAAERTFDQQGRGTFFGRFKARHLFYAGRPMRVLEGYLDEPFSLTNFRTREYIIENVTGPDQKGVVTIVGKDILSLAKDTAALCPTPSTGTLSAAMTNIQTTAVLQAGEGVDYDPAGGHDKHIRIDEEIMEVTSVSVDTLTVVRAQGGTAGVTHAIDDAVQECKTYEDTPVIDVIDDLLTNFANIAALFIPTVDWELEETETLTGYDLETIISEPTGVQTLLKEISEITLIDLWYSDVDQEIKLKLQTPYTSVTESVTDEDDVVIGSLKARDVSARRLSRVVIYYGLENFAEDLTEVKNYKFVTFDVDADKEGVNKFDNERVRKVFTRWMDASNSVQVALTAQRLLDRFGNTPLEIEFMLDAKDVTRLQTGDVFDFTSRIIQSTDGTAKTTRFQVVETAPTKVASQYRYKAWAFFQDGVPTSLTISTNQINFNLFIALGGPSAAVDVTVTVNAGVDVDSTFGNPAFETSGLHPDSLVRIVNNGDIRGYGGKGGLGGRAIADNALIDSTCLPSGLADPGLAGGEGGDAINWVGDVLTIDNTNGFIFAGAGGGGGGDGFHRDVPNEGFGGGGAGGGLGTDTGDLGVGGPGFSRINECGSLTVADGADGTDGSTSAPGTGGLKGGIGAGDGADGGADWGDDGDAASPGAGGGPGGFAIRLNGGSVIFEAGDTPAKVKGDVA